MTGGWQLGIDLVERTILILAEVDVELKIEFAEGELAHAGGSTHVVAGCDQFLEELFRNGGVSLMMSGKEIQ
jgi:hypothetical protein